VGASSTDEVQTPPSPWQSPCLPQWSFRVGKRSRAASRVWAEEWGQFTTVMQGTGCCTWTENNAHIQTCYWSGKRAQSACEWIHTPSSAWWPPGKLCTLT
jgi:hypothetical protein